MLTVWKIRSSMLAVVLPEEGTRTEPSPVELKM